MKKVLVFDDKPLNTMAVNIQLSKHFEVVTTNNIDFAMSSLFHDPTDFKSEAIFKHETHQSLVAEYWENPWKPRFDIVLTDLLCLPTGFAKSLEFKDYQVEQGLGIFLGLLAARVGCDTCILTDQNYGNLNWMLEWFGAYGGELTSM